MTQSTERSDISKPEASPRRRKGRRDPADVAIFQRADGHWVARIRVRDGAGASHDFYANSAVEDGKLARNVAALIGRNSRPKVTRKEMVTIAEGAEQRPRSLGRMRVTLRCWLITRAARS